MIRNILIKSQLTRAYCSSNFKKVELRKLKYKSKVPAAPVKSIFSEKTEKIKISEEEILLLEKLSLVDLDRT